MEYQRLKERNETFIRRCEIFENLVSDGCKADKALKTALLLTNNEKIVQEMENQEREVLPLPITSRMNSRGYYIQRYDEDDLSKPKEYFESALDVTRKIDGSSKSRILAAIANNHSYLGSRWIPISHEEDPMSTPNEIPPTKEITVPRKGQIALLTNNCDTILKVYETQRHAMKDCGYSSYGTISDAIKFNRITKKNQRFKYLDDCDLELRKNYEEDNGKIKPACSSNNNEIIIRRIHPDTDEECAIYPNIERVVKDFQVSRTKLKEILNTDKTLKGWKWATEDY